MPGVAVDALPLLGSVVRFRGRDWVVADREEDQERLVKRDRNGNEVWRWGRGWLLGFRDIARATDERTTIFAFVPRVGVGHTAPLLLTPLAPTLLLALAANLNSLVLDFAWARLFGEK
uniref:Uncharacterized protein n=1 Tax=Thermus tengchongensis TaxID=1214928 RepID=A0A7V4ALQ3_9DEIN